ncbi:hypothetical protein FACS189487_00870 [Campylobacterota bacterium]|nr:hypothetical protein FACS189487_00870 [Campylobacterota bacterium]
MVTVLVFSWFALLPDEYAQLGKHIAGGSAFISNFVLYFESGYWDTASNYKPLLHLWSLGVEEQFYIIFPVILFVLHKLGLRKSLFIVLLFIVSFALNLYYYKADMTLDFYMPFTRFWELMAGSMIAIAQRNKLTFFQSDYKPTLKTILSFVGFALLIAAIISSRGGSFPGINALAPVLGASLLILAGGSSILNRYLFSLKPIVFVGLISYPLYLWHWSLISYARIITGDDVSTMPIFKWILIAIAVLLSILTYYFIERPIRFSQNRRGLKAVILVVLLVIVGAMGIAVYYKKGIEDRWVVREMGGGGSLALSEMQEPRPTFNINCLERYGFSGFRKGEWSCELTDVNGSSTTAIVGNSHAHTAYRSIAEYNAKQGVNTVLFAHFSAHDIITDDRSSERYVEGVNEQTFLSLANDKNINKVFIIISHSGPDIRNKFQAAIDRISMEGREIFIVEPNPYLPHHIKEYIFTHPFWKSYKNILYRTRSKMLDRRKDSREMFAELRGVTIIYTIDVFCPIDRCLFANERGLPLYMDYTHLSINTGGNFLIEKALKPYLDKQ